MYIGVVFFTHTGHSQQVGEVIQQRLKEAGQSVTLIPLVPEKPFNLGAVRAPLTQLPAISKPSIC